MVTKPKFHKKTSSKTLTSKVKKLEKIVKADRPEHKFFSTANLGTTATITAGAVFSSITNIVDIAQGTDISQRIGNELKVLSVNYKNYLDVSSDNVCYSYRTFLIEDTQQISDTAPAVSDIFSTIHPNNYQLSIPNLKRFKILSKSDIRMQAKTPLVTTGSKFQELNIFHKFKYPLKIRYNGTASTDGQKNLLYIVQMLDASSSITQPLHQNVRVKYIDN